MELGSSASGKCAFSSASLLGNMTENSLLRLRSLWHVTEYPAGKLIVNAEDETDDVCFLLEGDARAAVYTFAGKEVSFLKLQAGDCFGEFSAIDAAPRSASVVALTPCRAAHVSAAQLREALLSDPELSFTFLTMLVQKLRALSKRVEDFSALRADQRIRQEIVRIARLRDPEDDRGLIEEMPNQSELAAFLFTNRESVAREISKLRKEGLAIREGKGLVIPSLERLELSYDCI